MAVLCTTSLTRKSATYDESICLGVGLYLFTHSDRQVYGALFHPPLSYLLHSVPLLALDVPEEVWQTEANSHPGTKLIALRSDDWVLNASRMALVPLTLLTGFAVFVWSRRLYGDWGGLLSLCLFCFSPNLIAHARLVTPDATLTCFTTLSAFFLWRLAREGGRRNLLAAGLCVGLMLLSKFSALVILPLLLASDLLYRISHAPGDWIKLTTWRSALGHWPGVLAIAVFVCWAGYFFQVGYLEVGGGFSIPIPAVDYFRGALFQFGRASLPYSAFLLGAHSDRGWWYFYLVSLALKLPIAVLMLLAATIALRITRILARDPTAAGDPELRRGEIYLWLPALGLLVGISLFNHIHSGIRYLLPVYPALLVWLGEHATATRFAKSRRVAAATAAAWIALVSVWIWPDYLSYANETIGGTGNAYRYLSDSNLDWGQDLEQLADFMREKQIDEISLSYFGTADPAHYGIRYRSLPASNSAQEMISPVKTPADLTRWVAISAYQYQGVGFKDKDTLRYFHRYEPNYLVGGSILVFDRENPIERSEQR